MGLFKKQSGGFTGNLDALTFESKEWKDGAKPYHTITMKLVISKDGADAPIEQYLPAGFFYPKDGQSISDDGETLENGAQVGENTEAARFIASAVTAGAVSESDLLDDNGNGTNFSALVGKRYDIGREINEERQLAAGAKKLGKLKAASASKEELMKAGRQQDKKDKTKFYNHSFLVIQGVLGDAAVAPAPVNVKVKEIPKSAAPVAKSAKGGKANGAIKTAPDASELAVTILVDFLADAKDNTLKTSALSSLVVRKAVEDDMDNDTRDAIRTLFKDAEFLGREEGWSFNADAKTVAQA